MTLIFRAKSDGFSTVNLCVNLWLSSGGDSVTGSQLFMMHSRTFKEKTSRGNWSRDLTAKSSEASDSTRRSFDVYVLSSRMTLMTEPAAFKKKSTSAQTVV